MRKLVSKFERGLKGAKGEMQNKSSGRALIGAASRGGMPEPVGTDAATFDEMYRSLRGFIHARCRRLLCCSERAEDATQEISLKLLAHWSALPPGEPTRRWLHRVTTNHCLNQLRNDKRRLDADLLLPDAAVPPPSDTIADRQLITRLLGSLPPELRLIGWLRHVDECQQHDIAEELRLSRRTVVSRLSTFRTRAKRVLKSL
jgi:RNA polymerase sigma factor (sigma-70 family)